jgi:hypothetical protein
MKQMFDDLNDEHLSKLKTTFVLPQ